MNARKIKVLIVDDSLFTREVIKRGLAMDKGIEVVGTAENPYEARDKIIELLPDVMTLDINMPRMSGIEFLGKLMPQYPIPTIVVSSVSDGVFDAMNAGAVDFVVKHTNELDNMINELSTKIKIAATAKLGKYKNTVIANKIREKSCKHLDDTVIAIGASTGGTEAILNILRLMPACMPPIVIVQHIPQVFSKMYADRLNELCLLQVQEAQTGDELVKGRVLIAPGGNHMRVKRAGKKVTVECYKGEKVNGHCPSVDVLFNSVAEVYHRNAVGVILTGMGYDGAKGMVNLRKQGARTIGQNQESCVVYGMPKVAYELGGVERQVSLEDIAQNLYSLIS